VFVDHIWSPCTIDVEYSCSLCMIQRREQAVKSRPCEYALLLCIAEKYRLHYGSLGSSVHPHARVLHTIGSDVHFGIHTLVTQIPGPQYICTPLIARRLKEQHPVQHHTSQSYTTVTQTLASKHTAHIQKTSTLNGAHPYCSTCKGMPSREEEEATAERSEERSIGGRKSWGEQC
jgi:hypothetical protein